MPSESIYNPERIKELELLLDNSKHCLFSEKYSKHNKTINPNLRHNKKLVDYINNVVNYTENFVTFQEKIRYFLLDKKEQHRCIICNNPTNIHKKTCSNKCKVEWYKINPQVKDSLCNAMFIQKNTFINGVSLKTISANKGRQTVIKNGGYKVTEESKQKSKETKSKINPATGLTSAQQGGKKLSENMSSDEREARSKRMKLLSFEIVACDIVTREEWTRSKLRSVLLAEKLKNTIDPITKKSLMTLKNEKSGKTKRKGTTLSDMREYRRLVKIYTDRSLKSFGYMLENIELRASHNNDDFAYHVDHKFSVSEGFYNSIPPFIIGSIHNLQLIPWRDNVSKSNKCSIDKEELIDIFYKEMTKSPTESPLKIDFS